MAPAAMVVGGVVAGAAVSKMASGDRVKAPNVPAAPTMPDPDTKIQAAQRERQYWEKYNKTGGGRMATILMNNRNRLG